MHSADFFVPNLGGSSHEVGEGHGRYVKINEVAKPLRCSCLLVFLSLKQSAT